MEIVEFCREVEHSFKLIQTPSTRVIYKQKCIGKRAGLLFDVIHLPSHAVNLYVLTQRTFSHCLLTFHSHVLPHFPLALKSIMHDPIKCRIFFLCNARSEYLAKTTDGLIHWRKKNLKKLVGHSKRCGSFGLSSIDNQVPGRPFMTFSSR